MALKTALRNHARFSQRGQKASAVCAAARYSSYSTLPYPPACTISTTYLPTQTIGINWPAQSGEQPPSMPLHLRHISHLRGIPTKHHTSMCSHPTVGCNSTIQPGCATTPPLIPSFPVVMVCISYRPCTTSLPLSFNSTHHNMSCPLHVVISLAQFRGVSSAGCMNPILRPACTPPLALTSRDVATLPHYADTAILEFINLWGTLQNFRSEPPLCACAS